MVYFFHHYELPPILQQYQLQRLLRDATERRQQAQLTQQPPPTQPARPTVAVGVTFATRPTAAVATGAVLAAGRTLMERVLHGIAVNDMRNNNTNANNNNTTNNNNRTPRTLMQRMQRLLPLSLTQNDPRVVAALHRLGNVVAVTTVAAALAEQQRQQLLRHLQRPLPIGGHALPDTDPRDTYTRNHEANNFAVAAEEAARATDSTGTAAAPVEPTAATTTAPSTSTPPVVDGSVLLNGGAE